VLISGAPSHSAHNITTRICRGGVKNSSQILNTKDTRPSLELAVDAARTKRGFRAVFVIPVGDRRRARLETEAEKGGLILDMVASFPDDTVPFTPASRWRGGRVGRKGYRHADSKLSVVVVASEDQGHLPVVNPASLFPRLASWYLSVAPATATDEAHLASTGIPLHYFHSAPAAEMQAFPEEWRFWKSRQPPPVDLPYAGGEGDSYRIDGLTPCADIIHSDPLLSLMGALPASFDAFLTFLGHKAGGLRPVRNKVRDLMSTYLKCAWISFTTREREHRLGRGKGEVRDTDGALGGDVGMDDFAYATRCRWMILLVGCWRCWDMDPASMNHCLKNVAKCALRLRFFVDA
jgi:hypothetical protein